MSRLLLFFASFAICFTSLYAEEKIHSISLKEYELERKISNALDPYLEHKDYVVKVKIDGERITEKPKTTSPEQGRINTSGQLPGFESQQPLYNPSITQAIGESYWKLKKLQVNLIMHKEVSPSVDQFIREAVPVVIGFDASRGDIFNFKPIKPKELVTEKEKAQKKKDAQEKLLNEQNDRKKDEVGFYGLTIIEWIVLGLLLLLILILVILYSRKVARLNNEISLLQEELEEESNDKEDFSLEKEKEELQKELQKEQKEREERRENEVHNAILRDENERILNKVIKKLIGRDDIKKILIDHYINQKDLLEKFIQFQHIIGPLTSKQLFQGEIDPDLFVEIQEKVKDIEIPAEEQARILNEIHSFALAKELQNPLNLKTDPFKFIHELSVGQIFYLIKDEPTNIKAVVLSRLDSERASLIIEKLDKDQRSKVVLDLGKLEDLPLDLLEKVAFDLANKAKDVPDENTADFDGVDKIIEVLGESTPMVREELINNLRVSDRKLSEKVESKLFIFDFIKVTPKDILMKVVRALPSGDVMTALHGSEKVIKEKVIFCFPEESRGTLVAKLKTQKPDKATVKENKKKIISSFQALAMDGKIDLRELASKFEEGNNEQEAVQEEA